MGLFDMPKRPKEIQLLNVENSSSTATVTYKATYDDKSTQNIRTDVRSLNSSFRYLVDPSITDVKYLGKVYIGFIKSDVRMLFLVRLSDGTVDIIQEKDDSERCADLLAKSNCENTFDNSAPSAEHNKYTKNSENIDIPIEILPNLYSLSLSNLSLKHNVTYKNSQKEFDYISLKCKVNYRLNQRKEGKRYIIFTSYDENDQVVEIRGDYEKYYFTEAGYEFVEVCFNEFDKYPIAKISVSVKEA